MGAFFFFTYCIKSIIDQVKQYSSYILRNDIYLLNAVIKICFKFSVERFIFGS